MAESIRSFIAFDLRNPEILEKISDVQKKLKETGANLKLVDPQNIHITLRFLGNIQPPLVDKIYREMEQIDFESFQIEICRIGAFPTLRHPRVIWAGIQKNLDKLEMISRQLVSRLGVLGFPSDSKPFSPHITFARVRSSRNKAELIDRMNELADYEFGVLRLDCLKLKKSVLAPRGSIYTTLKEVCR
ncbi:MAG: RNA 2',3'-cyclic phosphodiesterase [Candidatus Bathyarchaeota archaeon]|nr:RNA 2',3'-cyclic phosphodiesterase [Candidatus Bathyarchaeota archaeon]